MQFELSTGYKLWITKIGKNKKWSLLLSTQPNNNEFTKIGLIDDIISLKRLHAAFTGDEQWQA